MEFANKCHLTAELSKFREELLFVQGASKGSTLKMDNASKVMKQILILSVKPLQMEFVLNALLDTSETKMVNANL